MSALLVSSIARVDSLRDPQQVVAARSLTWTAAEDPGGAVDKGVQLSAIGDPDGNTITFIGNFRVQY